MKQFTLAQTITVLQGQLRRSRGQGLQTKAKLLGTFPVASGRSHLYKLDRQINFSRLVTQINNELGKQEEHSAIFWRAIFQLNISYVYQDAIPAVYFTHFSFTELNKKLHIDFIKWPHSTPNLIQSLYNLLLLKLLDRRH